MKLPILLFIFAIACAPAGILGIGRTQSAAVRGRLTCDGRPAANIKVKLFDYDPNSPDDKMAEGITDTDGSFELSGSENEISNIDPRLTVYHKCNYETSPCKRKISITIPDEYISEGKTAEKVFDAGTLNLDESFPGQTLDCFE